MKEICYSKELIGLWKKALIDTYGFEEYMDFIVQPTFTSKYLSYLPLLNYTDRSSNDIGDLLELAKENHYQIRTLNFEYNDFKKHDTVTLRLNIEDHDIKSIQKGYKKLARRHVNKEIKVGRYHLKREKKYLDIFYDILKDIYKRHGTPILPKLFFENLLKQLDEKIDIFILFDRADEPVAGVLFFYDNSIATLMYGGVYHHRNDHSTGYYLYHESIAHLIEKEDISIIDFGRSPYDGGTYFFKTRFGAKPVKIDIHTDTQKDIYSAYSLASRIWQKLPSTITETLGPKLTKYLVDL